MKSFSTLLVIFVASFVLVNCDKDDDVRAIMKKIATEYEKMSFNETKVRLAQNVDEVERAMTTASSKFEKEGLTVAARWYKSIFNWIVVERPKFGGLMNKMAEKEKVQNYMEMGIALQLIVDVSQMKRNGTNANTTAETEATAVKNFEQKKTRVLKIVKAVADGLRKKANKKFWADLHQNAYEFLEKLFKEIDTDMKSVKTSELRVKNYEKITAYLEFLLKATEFRARPPHSFFSQVGHKIMELADKIRSFF